MKSNSFFDLFQDVFSETDAPTTTTSTPPLYLHTDQGNDFRKLLHKNRKTRPLEQSQYNRMKVSATTQCLVNHQSPSTATRSSKKTYSANSPDFNPVIYLNQKQHNTGSGGFLSSVYNYLFLHEDRYFNQSRKELSKDIFPVGYQQQ
ncbi:hypothetical protein BDF20DRAFT_844984 [Mycotypha africana]|uniref:uncharacterized protein n=1 Tax=Mycotypha africana TaxID=64632 RepID=UPI002300E967|nr:uncharacterized protein BDF20DRAFT_844984 [Mycotypha africana]KAI8991497.1 hypothetical protein BDF20DRAFT_844984 [Mycotypha africana]